MNSLILILSLGLVLLPPLFASEPPNVDDLFKEYAKHGVPGAAVAVYHNGEIALMRAYGMADVSNGKETSTRTNYRLASVTKAFTAMAILKLIDAGKLSFEKTLTDIFPDFHPYGKKITVRHLLHHQGGMKDYENLIPSGTTKQLSDKDVLEIVKKQKSGDFTPGSRYRYSNGGYCVLSEIVAAVSGKSFATFVDDEILTPLGMNDSLIYTPGVLPGVPNRAYGYSGVGSGFQKTDQSVTSATQGDGGLYSSVEEMFLWNQALSKGTLLSPSLMELVFQPAKLDDGSVTKYGMGWMLDTYRGLKRQHHTGSTIGFRTSIIRIPERDFAVVTLINRANSAPWSLGDKIVDRFLF